jgi:transcriptional regulator with XRE-family HTH domain
MGDEINKINQSFVELIKKRREELGLTQAQLAECAGIGQPYVSKIESGTIKSPSLSTIKSLAEALEIDVEDLWDTASYFPDDVEIGYCTNEDCPGAEWVQNGNYIDWTPYKTALRDDEGLIEFCFHCGKKLLRECANCGRTMKRVYQYCPGCGCELLPTYRKWSPEEEEATNGESDENDDTSC